MPHLPDSLHGLLGLCCLLLLTIFGCWSLQAETELCTLFVSQKQAVPAQKNDCTCPSAPLLQAFPWNDLWTDSFKQANLDRAIAIRPKSCCR